MKKAAFIFGILLIGLSSYGQMEELRKEYETGMDQAEEKGESGPFVINAMISLKIIGPLKNTYSSQPLYDQYNDTGKIGIGFSIDSFLGQDFLGVTMGLESYPDKHENILKLINIGFKLFGTKTGIYLEGGIATGFRGSLIFDSGNASGFYYGGGFCYNFTDNKRDKDYVVDFLMGLGIKRTVASGTDTDCLLCDDETPYDLDELRIILSLSWNVFRLF